MLRAEAREELPGFNSRRLPRRGAVLGRRSRSPASARSTAARRIRAGDVAHDPKGGECPDLVRPLDDVPGEAHERERGASSRPSRRSGEVFVSAGAGTGKTAVLVERFVRAVCDEGLDVESVLVITYTRKAAGELRSRIRAALVDARPPRSRARARRGVDLHDPRLLHAAAARAPVRGRDRPGLPRARRRARRGAARRGVLARARDFCAGDEPRSAPRAPRRPTAAAGCARC